MVKVGGRGQKARTISISIPYPLPLPQRLDKFPSLDQRFPIFLAQLYLSLAVTMGLNSDHHSVVGKIEDAAEKVLSMIHDAEASLPCPLAHLKCDPCSILKHPSEKEYLAQISPENIGDAPLPSFDPGVLNNELLALQLYSTFDATDPKPFGEPKGIIEKGTYTGTQVALTQLYQRIEQTWVPPERTSGSS